MKVLEEDESRCEWKQEAVLEGSKVNEVKVENCSRVKDGNGKLAL